MDFNSIMKQAKKMQEEMERQQKALSEKEYHSTISSSIVEVTMNGDYNLTEVKINDDFAHGFTYEDKEILEDALCLAITEVAKKVTEDKENAMGDLAGSLKIPGLR